MVDDQAIQGRSAHYIAQLDKLVGGNIASSFVTPVDEYGDQFFGVMVALPDGKAFALIFLRDDEGNGPGAFEMTPVENEKQQLPQASSDTITGSPDKPMATRWFCSACGSKEIFHDASVMWDPDTQEWVVMSVLDGCWCQVCSAKNQEGSPIFGMKPDVDVGVPT